MAITSDQGADKAKRRNKVTVTRQLSTGPSDECCPVGELHRTLDPAPWECSGENTQARTARRCVLSTDVY